VSCTGGFAFSGGCFSTRPVVSRHARRLAACWWTQGIIATRVDVHRLPLRSPGIEEARRVLESADAKALVAAKRVGLSRSLLDLASLIATAQKHGWALVALDCALETTTPAGEPIANVLATFAQCERRSISQRTRAALALKRSQGVRLGRPPAHAPGLRRRASQHSRPDDLGGPRERTAAHCGCRGMDRLPNLVHLSVAKV
jgi:DNA invertase Pin-like site-specific DNA recombinase